MPPGGVDAAAVSAILGDPAERMLPMREIADRIAAIRGVSGCLLGHEDGDIMASATANRQQKLFGAIAPQIYKSIQKYLALLDVDAPQSLTLFTEPRSVFITRSESVFLIVVLPRSALSVRRINFFEVLCSELVRRLHGHLGTSIDPLKTI